MSSRRPSSPMNIVKRIFNDSPKEESPDRERSGSNLLIPTSPKKVRSNSIFGNRSPRSHGKEEGIVSPKREREKRSGRPLSQLTDRASPLQAAREREEKERKEKAEGEGEKKNDEEERREREKREGEGEGDGEREGEKGGSDSEEEVVEEVVEDKMTGRKR